MARKKVNLAYIANDAVRRSTFKKRRRGLTKKVSELATLCDVQACLIVYGLNEAQPVVWPSEEQARQMLENFRALPEMEQTKKMLNQEDFLKQRAKKLQDQWQKTEREARELEMTALTYQVIDGRRLDDVGVNDTTGLVFFVEGRMKKCRQEVKEAEGAEQAAAVMAEPAEMNAVEAMAAMAQQQPQPAVVAPPPPPQNGWFGGGDGQGYGDHGSPWMDQNLFNFLNGDQ